MVLSAPTILLPRVRIPHLFVEIETAIVIEMGEGPKIVEKETGIDPYLKTRSMVVGLWV